MGEILKFITVLMETERNLSFLYRWRSIKMDNLGARILVVEDDAQIRNFICYALRIEGYQYLSESTAQGAMSLLVSEPVDLMLLDLGLPDFDGMDVIKKVREWSEMPIIVVSARCLLYTSDAADDLLCVDLGGRRIIKKKKK